MDLIAGRYEPRGVVGRGGEGTLMRALDRRAAVDVALKVRPLPERTDAVMRMEHEAAILRNLRPHAGLPVVRDAFVDDTQAIIVMSWIDGRDLTRVLAEEGTPGLGFDAAIRITDQIADALDHLHGHNPSVVHGDVKPANVIIAPNGRAMLVDFGGATREGLGEGAPGTRGFRAPEVIGGEPPTPAADVYALAATFYALLAGRPPRFGVRSTWEDLDGGTAARVDAALRAGLATDPARRPDSASAFVSMLRPRVSRGRRGPTYLPSTLGRFVGRRQEVRTLAARLAESRLLTLTGPGGVGKSRLAIEVARRVAALSPDGVWLVPLDVSDPDHIPDRFAAALQLREAADVPVNEVVVEWLRDRRALLLLDGCERAPDAVAALITDLLEAAPHLRILATSRIPLGMADERVERIEPLPPTERAALELFWERARLADPGVVRRGANARAAAQICRTLQGMPLAIELAAAAVTERSPVQILERIESHDDPSIDAIERSIRWAHDGLDAVEQRVLRRLSIFFGGCRAEDAAAMCSGPLVDAAGVTPALWRLVDRGLLVVEDAAGILRYRLPDAVRDHARQRLRDAGERDLMRARRLAWSRDVAHAASDGIASPGQAEWLARIAFELDNLRAAMADGLRSGDPGTITIASDLARFWYLHGHWREGRWWLEQFLRDAPADSVKTAAALTACGRLCEALGDYDDARRVYERAVTILRASGEPTELGAALNGLAYTILSTGDLGTAQDMYEEARVIAAQAGDDLNHTGALLGRATVAATAQRWEEAIDYAQLSLAVARQVGEPAAIALCLTTLAGAEIPAGRFDDADVHLQEALGLRRLTGDRMGEAVTLNTLGELARRGRGDTAVARDLFHASLAIREEIGHAAGIATMLNNIGTVTDDLDEQRRAFDRSLQIRRRLGNDALTAIALRNLAVPHRKAGDLSQTAALLGESLDLEEKHRNTEGVAETLESIARLAEARPDPDGQDRMIVLAGMVRSGEVDVADAAAEARELLEPAD